MSEQIENPKLLTTGTSPVPVKGDVKPATAVKTKRRGNHKMTIPYACVKRMAIQSSGGMRVSNDTVYMLERSTEVFIKKVVTLAKSYTDHRGRKTITAKDIEAALENFSQN
jgi:histone H3/H4